MLVHICSRFRSSGTFDDFKIDIPLPSQFKTVRLLDCSIPQSQYIINANNNQVWFTDSATSYGLIPPGSYSATDLCTTMSSQMTVAGGQTYTCTYDSVTNRVQFQAAAPFTLNFSQPTSPWYELGFPNVNTTASTVHQSPNGVYVGPPPYLYLSIQGLGIPPLHTASNQPSGANFPLLITGNSYTVATWAANHDFDIECPSSFQNLGQLCVKLMDSLGRPAGLRTDFALTLLLGDSSLKSEIVKHSCKCKH